MPSDASDPLIPTSFDVAFTVAAGFAGMLAIVALITLLADRAVTGPAKVLWVAVIVFLPLVGAAVWLRMRVSPRR